MTLKTLSEVIVIWWQLKFPSKEDTRMRKGTLYSAAGSSPAEHLPWEAEKAFCFQGRIDKINIRHLKILRSTTVGKYNFFV